MIKVEWIMMVAFIGGLGLSVWKLYLFFPKTRLADDDTTPESIAQLKQIMVDCNYMFPQSDEETLLKIMTEHSDFDPKHYWRFNQNRLRHLIDDHRLNDPDFRL